MAERIPFGGVIRIRYHGHTSHRGSRITATWPGWLPEERPVRKTWPYEDIETLGPQIAEAYREWIQHPPHWPDRPRQIIDRVMLGCDSFNSSDWIMLIHTTDEEER